MKMTKTYLNGNETLYSSLKLENPVEADHRTVKIKYPKGSRPYKTLHEFYKSYNVDYCIELDEDGNPVDGEELVDMEYFRVQKWNGLKWETIEKLDTPKGERKDLIAQCEKQLEKDRYAYCGIKEKYIYRTHCGGIMVTENRRDYEDLYCSLCDDWDQLLGIASTADEAREILKSDMYCSKEVCRWSNEFIERLIREFWPEN